MAYQGSEAMSHEYSDGTLAAEMAERSANELFEQRRRDKSSIGGPDHVCGMHCDGQDGLKWPYRCCVQEKAGYTLEMERRSTIDQCTPAASRQQLQHERDRKTAEYMAEKQAEHARRKLADPPPPNRKQELERAPAQSWSERASSWAAETFGVPTPARALERTQEEFNELIAALEEPGALAGFGTLTERAKKAAVEAADTAICLAMLVESLNKVLEKKLGPHSIYLDLDNEIEIKMGINRKRAWRSNGDGTGQHIREPSEIYDERG
jgi:hypothetical protein